MFVAKSYKSGVGTMDILTNRAHAEAGCTSVAIKHNDPCEAPLIAAANLCGKSPSGPSQVCAGGTTAYRC